MFSLKDPVQSFIKTTKGVFLSPIDFFRSENWSGVTVVDALIYTAICSLIAEVFKMVIPSPTSQMPFGAAGGSFPSLLIAPITTIAFLLIGTLVIFATARILFKTASSYTTALAATSAVSATILLSWIPVVGLFVGLYALVLTTIAVREALSLSTVQAIVVVVIEFILITLVVGTVIFSMLSAFSGGRMMPYGAGSLNKPLPLPQ